MSNLTKQAVVTAQTSLKSDMAVEKLALFDTDGTPFTGLDQTFAPITVAGLIGTAAKTTASAEPVANSLVPLLFTSGNSAAAPTVAFNGGTARAIYLGGATPSGAEITIAAAGVGLFWFDGTILHQVGLLS